MENFNDLFERYPEYREVMNSVDNTKKRLLETTASTSLSSLMKLGQETIRGFSGPYYSRLNPINKSISETLTKQQYVINKICNPTINPINHQFWNDSMIKTDTFNSKLNSLNIMGFTPRTVDILNSVTTKHNQLKYNYNTTTFPKINSLQRDQLLSQNALGKFYDSFQIVYTAGEKVSIRYSIYQILTISGWPFSDFIHCNRETLYDLNSMSKEQIDEYMTQLMTESNCSLLNKEIDIIINSLNNSSFNGHNGFKKQMIKMKELFNYDNDSIICFGPTLFSLIECLNVNGKYFKKFHNTSIANKKFFENVSSSDNPKLLSEASVFEITMGLYNSTNNKSYKYSKDGLNRHMVEHGFLSPEKINITEFCKLILICSTFAQI